MKTAFVRCEAFSKIDRNGKSRSVISTVAYIAGVKMYDDLTKKNYNYSRKKEVVSSKMFWTKDAQIFFNNDPQKFFNALQKDDQKKDGTLKPNARLAKKYVLAIPNELSQNAAEDLMVKTSRYFTDYDLVSIGAVNWQDGNHHIYFLVSDKVFKNGRFQRKNANKNEYQLDKNGNKIPIIDPVTGLQKTRTRVKNGKNYLEKCWKRTGARRFEDSKEFLAQFKTRFVTETNRLLAKEGFETQISMKPEAGQESQIHIGAAAWNRHKKGLYSSRYEQNERIKMRNRKVKELKPAAIYKPTKAEQIDLETLRGLSERAIENLKNEKI